MTGGGLPLLAGVDEVGRGPLAGPVAAAAVILGPEEITGINDSKLLGPRKREHLAQQIRRQALAWCIACASVTEIEQINIRQASLLAMRRAVEGLPKRPDKVLVDGNCLPQWSFAAEAIIGGDRKVKVISAASILAKVWRDGFMTRLHEEYPAYHFSSNKGYPTPEHLAALRNFGATPVHRHSFAPVRRVCVDPIPELSR
ncbi:MAG TPA: ribonuclease HII [Gammaproteobacteria bacterium]|nr:ribonuclease HII [Gammaproteobacteria bacterium]